MAAGHVVRALLGLHHSMTLRHRSSLLPVPLKSTCHFGRLYSSDTIGSEPKPPVNPENESLLENLNLMGVDVMKARQRQPGVLRRSNTNEQGLAHFLKGKGASRQVIAGIISRYPRSITRSIQHLDQRWELWKNIFKSDLEIVRILDRSPESFFRSSDNQNLEKNIAFLTELGLTTKDVHQLLSAAPRTFSNSVQLNKRMVELLEDICVELGGEDPRQFAKAVISRNVFILIRSTKRVKTNLNILRASLKLNNSELLQLLQGRGVEFLDFSNEYLKKNFKNLQQKMVLLGCRKADVRKLIISYPTVLYMGSDRLNCKLDCLLNGGISMKQILDRPKVLDYSTQNITGRLVKLEQVGFDFKKNGINVLESSQKRFITKLEKLNESIDE